MMTKYGEQTYFRVRSLQMPTTNAIPSMSMIPSMADPDGSLNRESAFHLFVLNSNAIISKNSDASTLQAPETKKYDEWIGSLRVSREMSERTFFLVDFPKGFRPPSAYDLTSTDETSINEAPNRFVSRKFRTSGDGSSRLIRQWNWQASYYHTWIKDMIVRSPTKRQLEKPSPLRRTGMALFKVSKSLSATIGTPIGNPTFPFLGWTAKSSNF